MARLPLSLGLKLPLDWRGQQACGLLPRFSGEIYAFLRENGFSYVEFGVGSCREWAEKALLRSECAACHEFGLRVALHPYLIGPDNPASFGVGPQAAAALEAILAAAAGVGAASGEPALLVVHPAAQSHAQGADVTSLRARLIERSQAFFAEMERLARDRYPLVEPVAEHQVPPAPGEAVVRIGDTYGELLQAVAGTDLGLCLDTGHYVLSVERHGQAAAPPAEFLSRVRAVHLHDVVDGRDHQPVSATSAVVGGHVKALLRAGFAGAVTLEYEAAAIASEDALRGAVAEALSALALWVGESGALA